MPTAHRTTPAAAAPAGERRKSPEEVLRESVNAAAVVMVDNGFQAIDQLAERGKNYLKRQLIRAISGK